MFWAALVGCKRGVGGRAMRSDRHDVGAMLLAGWRPSIRLLGQLFVGPLLSVSVVAWLSGNAFNGAVFALVVSVLITTTVRLPKRSVRLASPAAVVLGAAAIAFGWTYPHFVSADSWIA